MTARATLREQIAYMCERHHDDFVERNRAIFLEFPPDDFAPYAYTYYDGNGTPIYNGYTTDARRRAKEHFKYAPWASWIEDVRYRRCTTAKAARRLESRLGKKIPAIFRYAYHGLDWSDNDREFRINHVTGTCKLPGGTCGVDRWMRAANAWLARQRVAS